MAATIQQILLLLLAIVLISFSHYDQCYAKTERAAAPEPAAGSGLESHRGIPLIERVCRQTQFYFLCLSSMQSDARTPHTADTKGLLSISIDRAIVNGTHILGYIDNFLDANRPSSVALNISSLEACGEYYDDSVTRLQWAMESFDGHDAEDYDSANDYIEDAINSIDHCNREIEDGEVGLEELPGPLTNMNEIMSELLHISQDILCYLAPDSCNIE